MRFKIDENMPLEAASLFETAGHLCATVFEEDLNGHTDAEVACAEYLANPSNMKPYLEIRGILGL
jgi:hypothetical protein